MRAVSAKDQLSEITRQISETLNSLDTAKCFELPRSLSMDRLSHKSVDIVSESFATVMNSSKSLNELAQHAKNISNPTSIFTPDPFSKIDSSCQTNKEESNEEPRLAYKNNLAHASIDACTQIETEANSVYDETLIANSISPKVMQKESSSNIILEMKLKIESLEKEVLRLSMPKIQKSISTSIDVKNVENLEIIRSKLKSAEAEVKALKEQNHIIAIENQKLILSAASKRENLTKEREVLYSFIHDFSVNSPMTENAATKSLIDQVSKAFYSLVEHSNDNVQLNRMKDLFLSFKEAIMQIANESIQLDERISSLAQSSCLIRMESKAVITQLEEKNESLLQQNQELRQEIIQLKTAKDSKNHQDFSHENVSCQEYERKEAERPHAVEIIEKLEKINEENELKEEEIIRKLELENQKLRNQLSSLEKEAKSYPLSDLYEKIVTLMNRDAAGINIKEILEWVEEKRVVSEELEKLRCGYSNLSYKHKHLLKEYSDQKSSMDEIQTMITKKEAEWQAKFQDFVNNANKLEERHSALQSILSDYTVQFQGVLSLSSDQSPIPDHPLPFLRLFGNLHKSVSSLDHSLQHATSALSESQRVTNHALQNLDVKSSQILLLEKEKQEIQTLITKFKSELSSKDKEITHAKSQLLQLQDHNLKLSEKLKRISDAFKWTMM